MEYSEKEIREHYRQLTKLLIEKKLTITTMESATSGQIASLITDTEGSSAVLHGAMVTYCNEAKIACGVPKEVIDTYTVYSKETAEAMAAAADRLYPSDLSLGVTGTMGNVDPLNAEASVPGVLYFSILYQGKYHTRKIDMPPMETRLLYKLCAAEAVCQNIMTLI